jgi:hypothetical protein
MIGARRVIGRTSMAGELRSHGQARKTLHFRFFAVKRGVSEKRPTISSTSTFVRHVALVVVVVVVADGGGRPTLIGGTRHCVVEPGKAEIAFGLANIRARGLAPP